MTKTTESNDKMSQSDKFKEAARAHEADEDEAAWDKRLKQFAKAKPAPVKRNP